MKTCFFIVFLLSITHLTNVHAYTADDYHRFLSTSNTSSTPTTQQITAPTSTTSTATSPDGTNSSIVCPVSEHEEAHYEYTDVMFWVYLSIAAFMVCFAGLCSGLTVGYLSIDELQLDIKLRNGTDEEKRNAAIIMPILSKHHHLLSTLLVSNAFAMESLPICLDSIMPAYLAVLLSTSFVVVFGEILPQAYCTGPDQIKIAAKMAPVVTFMMKLLWVICYPMSLYLDSLLGTHQSTRFGKRDLKALIELHQMPKQGDPKNDHGEINRDASLTAEEIRVINSTIDLRDTPVVKEMEPIEKVFMISDQTKITPDLIKKISEKAFSKIPVYKGKNKNQIVGILKAKSLIDYQDKYLDQTIKESNFKLLDTLVVPKDTSMLEMLMLFQTEKTAIALISDDCVKDKQHNSVFTRKRLLEDIKNKEYKLVGLISLKDIFEEILESKLVDDDMHAPVTLPYLSGSAQPRAGGSSAMPKRGNSKLNFISEAEESTERNLKKPLLK